MDQAVVFGAGNIGRSFIGNIFVKNGLKVTFVDANTELVKNLNCRKGYRIIIKRNNQADEVMQVSNVEAVHISQTERIIEILGECRLSATAVGQAALPKVVPVIAEGIKRRIRLSHPPLDVIIAENIRGGADFFRKILKEKGLNGNESGLVETSIGKMVPIMTKKDLEQDPLLLHAEEYNTLILDRQGFMNDIPEFPEIKAVQNIAAWVDRKLFIHNLGHAASAYLGYQWLPDKLLIADVLENKKIRNKVRRTMQEAAAALLLEYPADFTATVLDDHIDNLIFRFRNKALGDTVFRVGRDLPRKLGKNDRILGSARLCSKHGLPFEAILDVFAAAVSFSAPGPNGKPFERDYEFVRQLKTGGLYKILTESCRLDPKEDGNLIKLIESRIAPFY